jgi:RimJ/RimL family protein N-acetyltransferase
MNITQRNATLSDADVLLYWRNHPNVRRFSLQSELIPFGEHLKWLQKRLNRTQCEPFYLYEFEDELVGMCRLDLVVGAPGKYEVSILIDPDQHAKGLGTKVLAMSCESFFTIHPNDLIVAKIKRDNIVSKKLFENAGFVLQNNVGDFLYLEKHSN